MKKHLLKNLDDKKVGELESQEDENQSSTFSSDYSDDDDDEEDDGVDAAKKKIKNQLEAETDSDSDTIDIPTEELERFSEDEIFENRAEKIKESNKKKSQQSAENIQHQMS
jgi:hypothetical protein